MLGLIPVAFRNTEEEAWWHCPEGVALIEGLLDEVDGLEALRPVLFTDTAWVRHVALARGIECRSLPPSVPEEDPAFPGSVAVLGQMAGTPSAAAGVLLVHFRYPLTPGSLLAEAVRRFQADGGRTVGSAMEVREHPCQSLIAVCARDAGLIHLLDPEAPGQGDIPGPVRPTRPFPFNWRRYGVDPRPGTLFQVAQDGGVREWSAQGQASIEDYLLRYEAKEAARLLLPAAGLDRAEPVPGARLIGCSRPHGRAPSRLLLWEREGEPPILTGSDQGPGWLNLYPFGPQGGIAGWTQSVVLADLADGARLAPLPLGCLGLAYTTLTPPVGGVHDLDIHTRSDNLWGTSPLGSAKINLVTGNQIFGRNDFVVVYERTRAFAVLGPEALAAYGWKNAACETLIPSPLEVADTVESAFDILRCSVMRAFRQGLDCPDGLSG